MATHISHLKKLGGLFENLAIALRKKKRHRKADGSTGGKVEAQLDKTEGAEGFQIKVDEPVAETAVPYYDIASDAAPPAIADTPAGTQVIDGLGDLGDGAEGFVASKGTPVRPTWRQSEIDVGAQLESQGYKPQISFKDGAEVPYGTKGSVRPEYYREGASVEVKNYNVETAEGRARLERNVVDQAIQRADNLPSGTTQSLTIDVRGQNVTRAQLNQMLSNIEQKSGGTIIRENINILR